MTNNRGDQRKSLKEAECLEGKHAGGYYCTDFKIYYARTDKPQCWVIASLYSGSIASRIL